MGLHKNIVLKDSPIYGSKHQGLYAIGPIKKGEIIWHVEPFEEKFWYDLDTINSWDEEKRNKFMSRAYIVKEGVYSGIIDDSWDDSECMVSIIIGLTTCRTIVVILIRGGILTIIWLRVVILKKEKKLHTIMQLVK
jgi:hypothetical protein